mgnify:CR=1 FL=1
MDRRGFLSRLGAAGVALGLLTGCATLSGCREPTPAEGFERVRIDGRTFTLELAVTGEARERGLGGREHVPADGGMLFVFPDAAPRLFVMRDCLVPIDIIYLDPLGRIVSMHQMEVEPLEPPRQPGESEQDYQTRRMRYEARLRKYPSGYAAQFVIELAGGTLDSLRIGPGDRIELDLERLKALVK